MALKHWIRLASHCLRDQAGVSALEFALTAPLLIASLAGMGELSQLLVANRNVINITTSLADLTSQAATVTTATLNDQFSIASNLMSPLPVGDLSMRITSVVPAQSQGPVTSAVVLWCKSSGTNLPCASKGSAMGAMADGSSFQLGLLPAAGSNVIVAETSYTYTSPILMVLPTAQRIAHVNYFNPRVSTSVPCADC